MSGKRSKILRQLALSNLLASDVSDTTAPTLTITALSAVANVVEMQITASEVVTGFAVGDITISAGGSLASFTTADNITFTVSWTLAAGANTMDIGAGVCVDAGNNPNDAATQYGLTYYSVQPDATAGLDTMIRSGQPITNYGTNTLINLGEHKTLVGDTFRPLVKFTTLSNGTIPANAEVLSAVLSLWTSSDASGTANNNRIANVYRVLRAWVEVQATWSIFSNGNDWGTAGCSNTTTDREGTSIGSSAFTTTELAGTQHNFNLTPSAIQEIVAGTFTNNGFAIIMETEDADLHEVCSSDHATAGQRPRMDVVYHVPL